MSGVRVGAWAVLLVVVVIAHSTPSHAHFGSCEDHTPECLQWALAGWCKSNRQYMLQNCPVSCNLCLDPDCFDTSPFCNYLVRRGGCRTREILDTCPHSCDSCSIGSFAISPATFRESPVRSLPPDVARFRPSLDARF